MKQIQRWFQSISSTRMIALGFLGLILIGTALLCLPVSAKDGQAPAFLDALFTAVSATCVTGLVVVDTYSYWSVFGQLVILVLIQVGGIGLMTVITMFFLFAKKKIGLHERMLLVQSAGNMRVSGIVRLVKRILKGTLIIEGVGTVLLAIRFCTQFGPVEGLYYAVFHSVSAFCNAGFDLMGRKIPFSSLTSYETDPLVSLTIMLLIILGGIGFLVWDDLVKNGIHFRKYSLHTKIVLVTTGILIVVGTVGFWIFEQKGNLEGMNAGDQLLSSAFLSVTTRTAGFNSMDTGGLSEAGNLLAMVLMFIGGSPGSTAGGIKTSTLAIIFLAMGALTRGQNDVVAFKKRLEVDMVKQAAVILLIYLAAVFLITMVICHMEGMLMVDVAFEVVSAIGTVGLSRGVTQEFGVISRLLLILLMYSGRIGGLSMMLVFRERKREAPLKRPSERILIG